jgi:NADPH:quinone reductase-like Zn-dependent oxidoreductase
MRHLRFSESGLAALRIEDAPRPSLERGRALVQVKAAGLNPSDLTNVKGGFPQTTLPRTPGRDYAGVVVDGPQEWLEANVWGSGAELGFTEDGTHAEYVVVPAPSLVRKPTNLSFAAAAAAGVPFIAAWMAMVEAAQIAEGETALVIGSAGSVGQAARQLAQVRKARVLGVDKDNNENVPQWVRRETGGRGADVCLDTVSGPMFPVALESLAISGRLAVIVAKGDGNVTLNLRDFYHRGLRMMGIDSLQSGAEASAAIYRELLPLFESGALTIEEPERIPLDHAIGAYHKLETTSGHKMVLIPG